MKTFNSFLKDNPTFWDNHSNYPVAVQKQVNDWFYYRQICSSDDEKYARMLGRKLDILSSQFDKMYEAQMKEFSPLQLEKINKVIKTTSGTDVVEAIKKELGINATTNASLDSGATSSATSTNTTTNNLETRTTDTGTVTDARSNDTTTDSKTSDFPQSTPSMSFADYISAENLANTNETSSGTTTNNLETDTKNTGTSTVENTSTSTSSNTEENVIVTNQTNTENNNRTNKIQAVIDVVLEEIRDGGVDVFERYFKTLKTINAVSWLIGELDCCFIQIFDWVEFTDVVSSAELAELEARVSEVENDVVSLDSRVTKIEEEGGCGGVSKEYVDNKFNAASTSINIVDGKVDLLTVDLQSLETEVRNNNTNISTLTSNLTQTNANLEGLTDLVHTNTDNITTLTSVVENNTNRIQALEEGGVGGGGNLDKVTMYDYQVLKNDDLIGTFTSSGKTLQIRTVPKGQYWGSLDECCSHLLVNYNNGEGVYGVFQGNFATRAGTGIVCCRYVDPETGEEYDWGDATPPEEPEVTIPSEIEIVLDENRDYGLSTNYLQGAHFYQNGMALYKIATRYIQNGTILSNTASGVVGVKFTDMYLYSNAGKLVARFERCSKATTATSGKMIFSQDFSA